MMMNDILDDWKNAASKYGAVTALVDDHQSYTFDETERMANGAARQLTAKGIQRGDYVALSFTKCAEYVVSVIACLKLGCVAVPIFPSYPAERVEMIARSCGVKLMLTADGTLDAVKAQAGNIPVLCVDPAQKFNQEAFDTPEFSPEDPAFAFYTSGSTGTPKGVLIPRRAPLWMARYYGRVLGCREGMRQAVIPPWMFVISLGDIFSSLMTGGTLYIPNMETSLNPALLHAYSEKNEIMHLTAPTRLGIAMLSAFGSASLENIGLGGEAMPAFADMPIHLKVYNGFGMTETCAACVYSSFWTDDVPRQIPIGKPFEGTNAYVLNDMLEPVADGEKGELCLSGQQIALGYIGLPELTAKVFVKNPFSKDETDRTLLRTGDVVSRGKDGNLYYYGRRDNMINLHGFRIEPEEIERTALGFPGIQAATAAQKTVAGAEHLCLYYTAMADLDVQALKAFLMQSLPEYMNPSYIVRLERMPLTPSGKVARNLLPDIQVTAGEYIAPETDSERLTAQVFADVLGCERVSVEDDFFRLGGHSLRAMKVVNKLLDQTGVLLTVRDVFTHPTARTLAKYLEENKENKCAHIQKAVRTAHCPMSPVQRRLYYIEQMGTGTTAYNLPRVLEVTGRLDAERLTKALRGVIARNAVLRTRFDTIDGEAMQVIEDTVDFDVPSVHLPHGTSIEEELRRFTRPFDLSKAPLLRAELAELEGRTYLLLDIHHIVFDGGSTVPLLRQLSALYAGETLPENELEYADYCAQMNACDLSAQGEYWHTEFADGVPVLNLPPDMPRPSHLSGAGGRVTCSTCYCFLSY